MRQDKGSKRKETQGTLALGDFIDFLEDRGSQGVRYVFIKGNDNKMEIELLGDFYFGRKNVCQNR